MKKFKKALGHQGFTVVEIMVALMLVVLVFALVPSGAGDEEAANMDKALEDFKRAVRFSVNEAVLRNSIVRLSIDLAANPQEYVVEYSTEGGLALPESQPLEDLSFDEREIQEKAMKDLDSQFQKVAEFSEEPKTLPFDVTVLGLANANRPDIVQDGRAFVYFYPTGEKDAALLFLTTTSELAALSIPPFENTTFSDYYTYSEVDLRNIEASQQEKMKELREEWAQE